MSARAAEAPLVRPGARDFAIAAALVALALATWAFSPPQWLWGDGTFLLEQFVEGRALWMHATYLPLARFLSHVPGLEEPVVALRAASGFGMALGLAGAWLVARRVGVGRLPALVVTMLLVFAPAVWFFALQVEVHGTQFATIAFAVLVLLAAPWRMPVVAIGVSALAMGLAHLGHQSAPALGPGFVLLARYAAWRAGRPIGWGKTCLVLGPALVLGLVAAEVLLAALGQPTLLFSRGEHAVAFAAEHHNPPSWRWWEDDVIRPAGHALVPSIAGLAVVALRALRGGGAAREFHALAALVAIPMVVFALWAVDNRGGYLAATLPFLPWIGGRAVPARHGRALVSAAFVALVPFQFRHGLASVRAEAEQWDRARHLERAAAVAAALPDGGKLIAFQTDPQSVQQFVGNVREYQWFWPLQDSLRAGEPTEKLVERLVGGLVAAWAGEPLAFDLGHRRYVELVDTDELRPWLERVTAIEAALAEHFEPVPIPDAGWPLVRLVPR